MDETTGNIDSTSTDNIDNENLANPDIKDDFDKESYKVKTPEPDIEDILSQESDKDKKDDLTNELKEEDNLSSKENIIIEGSELDQDASNASETNKSDKMPCDSEVNREKEEEEEISNVEDNDEETDGNKNEETEIENNEKEKNVEEIEDDGLSQASENNFQEENESRAPSSNEQIVEESVNEENLAKDTRESSMPDNILNIEEVDAHVSINKTNQDYEEDVLSDDRTQTAEKQKSPQQTQMEIDPEEINNKISTNDDTLDDTSKASDAQDVEMRSVESIDVSEKEKSAEPPENEKSLQSSENEKSLQSSENEKSLQSSENEKLEQQFEMLRKSPDVEQMETEDIEYDKDNTSQNDKDESIGVQSAETRDEPDNLHDTANQSETLDNAENDNEISENQKESTENDNEINESQTENVQEETQGESADVCLIPDNDEELTGAEKEQAILARQNAEKEDAEKEQAENEVTESTTDQDKEIQLQEDSQEIGNEVIIEPDVIVEIDNSVKLPLPTKTLIVLVIHSDQKCVECREEKSCEFRYKNDETGLYSYVCNQECCDALIRKEKNRFFVRKRKYIVEDLSESKMEVCVVCKEEKKCKYTFKQDEDIIYICSDDCFNLLSKEEPDKLKLKRNSIRVKNLSTTSSQMGSAELNASEVKIVARTTQEAEIAKLDRDASFERVCAGCGLSINQNLSIENLIWETFDFCNQMCLSKFQHTIGEKCRTCQRSVSQASLGKYCVRFGFEICQFCCASCLDKYKKSLKNCSYCQNDISKTSEGFLAPVGDNEQFRDFCSQNCMKKYDALINPKRKAKVEQCSVCNNKKMVQVELILDERGISFCSNPCFSAFKFVNNIIPDKCNLCPKYFERKSVEHFTVYVNNVIHIFCGKICMNMFITQNRKIVFCQWCKVKKYNFDMIEKQSISSEKVIMCSLNCLVLYGVSLNRITKQKVKCDNCRAEKSPQYHLTMSDSSMRNFCTYQCVMQFQSQFSSTPLTLDSENNRQDDINQLRITKTNTLPFPTGLPKRIKSNVSSVQTLQVPLTPPQPVITNITSMPVITNITSMPVIANITSMPVIANITSLASDSSSRKKNRLGSKKKIQKTYPSASAKIKQNLSQNRLYDSQIIQPKPAPVLPMPKIKVSKKTIGTPAMHPARKSFVVEFPPEAKSKINMNTQCMPLTETIGVTCKPQSCDSEIQTDNDLSSKKLIPVPIPIYIPQPIQGYPIPRPIPVPFIFPIPVPIFIPTTKNSAQGIMKEIKKIQDKMPADPYEAELLMMAELVASDKKKEEESEDENNDVSYNNDNSYGEDVLQMALKMATEYDEPSSVDLQSTITPSNISQSSDNESSNLIYHQMQINQRLNRGKKRVTPTNVISREDDVQPIVKKRRSSENEVVIPSQTLPIEKPDANMCLKYTFGVNAWKQWVITKNTEIEKSSIRRKQFKSELLQMTADELNYSLCLFVKEVRKPNGTEYAPDTIYYLVLGIQQYLYENGRIDNIFTDPYYERFTDCLDEVARKFSVLYNDSQYIVTRVEEEHLWECKQLGAHSPHVLLSTLMFFNTKHFNLTTVEEHMQLSFSHIMKHWKRNSQGTKQPGSRNVLLRFYPPNTGQDSKKKKVYEQQENEANPLRCPVRLYEFYLSKCPESVKTRNDVFYLQPERSCVPDSPVWYSTQPLSQESLQKMLHRVKMVKEINVALLTI